MQRPTEPFTVEMMYFPRYYIITNGLRLMAPFSRVRQSRNEF